MAYSADRKPGELTPLTTLATDDVFVVGDTSDASEVAKGITKANLITDLNASLTPALSTTVTTNANLTGHVTSVGNAAVLGSFTKAQLDTAVSDGNVLYVGDISGISDGDKGDITVSASGATWTIDNSAVTLAKQADMATASVVYRKTAGTGVPEVQTLATLKTDLGLTGTNSGDQTTIAGITGTMAQFDTAVSDGNIVYQSQALGTPSSGTVTNLTGTASININGTVGATTPTTVTGTVIQANTGFIPDANDGAYLGTTTAQFSDLFLAEGGVINWDNGDATLTQTGNVLALAGADLQVATAGVGTNADSVPTLSSTSTLTNKTLTAPTLTGTTVADRFDYDRAIGLVNAIGNLGATETFDWSAYTHFTGNLDSNITIDFSNAISGQSVSLYLTYSGAARTIAYTPTIVWLDNASGVAPTPPQASGNVLVATIAYIGTTYYGSATGNYAVYA